MNPRRLKRSLIKHDKTCRKLSRLDVSNKYYYSARHVLYPFFRDEYWYLYRLLGEVLITSGWEPIVGYVYLVRRLMDGMYVFCTPYVLQRCLEYIRFERHRFKRIPREFVRRFTRLMANRDTMNIEYRCKEAKWLSDTLRYYSGVILPAWLFAFGDTPLRLRHGKYWLRGSLTSWGNPWGVSNDLDTDLYDFNVLSRWRVFDDASVRAMS